MNTHILKFTLNEKELTEAFINSIKPLFSGKDIIISISEDNGTEVHLHTSYTAKRLINEVTSDTKEKNSLDDKGNPSSKGAGGQQPPKITIEFF